MNILFTYFLIIIIRFLELDEILEQSKDFDEIFLMNENSFINFKKYIKYDIINNYINLKDKEKKNNYLKNNINEFNEILTIIKNKVKLTGLIKNYQDCIETLKNENKFYLIKNNNHIIKNNGIEEIRYFTYNSNNYILFKDNKKVFKIEIINEEYWILIECNLPKEINKNKFTYNFKNNTLIFENLMEIIEKEIVMNKNEENLRKYINISKYEDIKDFYLIGEDLLDKEIDKNKYELINSINNFDEIPKHFGIIEKNRENESIIEKMKKQKTIFQYKILFINEYKQKINNIYIGIINDTKYNINFYLIVEQDYSLEYIINYKSKDLMVNDIENNIIPKGIATYIYETGTDFSNTKTNKLFNKKLELIGYIANLNNKNYNLKEYSNNLETFEDSYYYIALIQCLVNIKPLKKLFLNKELLFNEKIVQDYKKVTKYFYKIMQYVWNVNNNEEEKKLCFEFLYEIQALSQINNIYDSLELLLDFLLYAMHIEQRINSEEIKINYDLNSIKNNIKEGEKSFIQKLFLFKLENQCKTCKNTNYYNFILNINMKEIIKNNSEIIDISINNILNLRKTLTCKLCTKTINDYKIEFKICPKILVICFQEINLPNLRFKINEEIDLKNNISKNNKKDNIKYKLISIIREKKRKNVILYAKSPINNLWCEYRNGKIYNKNIKFNDNQNDYNYKIPNLLIYEKA